MNAFSTTAPPALLIHCRAAAWICMFLVCGNLHVQSQPYGEPDTGSPGDAQIQEYLREAAERVEGRFLNSISSAADWAAAKPRLRQEYFHMLGLWPLPQRTPLRATVTRSLNRGDYTVDMVHYQSRPGLYVTGNLFRPSTNTPGARFPAILYVCGHSPRGRNGNKTAYQSHGIWFARHGYVCLVLDTLEMGEITCTHHGTYREGRWWWLSRGYTPAGVECWNGVRGIDYLVSRPDVDPDHIGVTGISGGGAATFWISAADERVKAVVPVSGLSDLLAQVPNRVVNGHCDCMFMYNTYQWPWALVAGMIAPRPLLFVNSNADPIFPMDGNERVINRLERLYSVLGAGDYVDSVVSIGGHAYREDIRKAAFRFMNTHLKNDPRPITDSEVDLTASGPNEYHPIAPEQLRVFPEDSDIPKDAINGRVDYEFVAMGDKTVPERGAFEPWRANRISQLIDVTFHHFPETIPPASRLPGSYAGPIQLATEGPVVVRLKPLKVSSPGVQRVLLFVSHVPLEQDTPPWFNQTWKEGDAVYGCEPRGIGRSAWTTKNPPNYVERALYLLGRTADSGRVWDIIATTKYLRELYPGAEMILAGETSAAVLATYAALLNPEVSGLMLAKPVSSLMEPNAPVLLNVLRVCDVPQAIGMVAPRPVTLIGTAEEVVSQVRSIYETAGARERLTQVQ